MRAGHPDDRRPVVAATPRTGGRRATRSPSPAPSPRSKLNQPAERRGQPLDRRRGPTTSAPIPSGPEQPLLGGHRVEVGAELVEAERDRAGRLGAVDDARARRARGRARRSPATGRTAPGRPQRRATRDTSRVPGVIARVEGGERPLVVAVVAGVDERELDAVPVAQRVRAARAPPACSCAGRDGPVAGAPVEAQRRRRSSPSVVEWVRATAPTSVPRTAATPARASAIRLRSVLERSRRGPRPTSRSQAAISAIAAAVSAGQRPDRAGVQVDPGGERRERRPDGRELLRVGQEGGDHGRMIPSR